VTWRILRHARTFGEAVAQGGKWVGLPFQSSEDSGLGHGGITSLSPKRQAEGTTFECSCYTNPLGIEHLTPAG